MILAMAWCMPSDCKVAVDAAERRSSESEAGGKGGGKGGSSSRPSKGGGKGSKGSKGQSKGAGRGGQPRGPPTRTKPAQADPLGIVATFAALKQMQPMLQSLGFGGTAPQRPRPKTQPGGKSAGEAEQPKKKARGGKPKGSRRQACDGSQLRRTGGTRSQHLQWLPLALLHSKLDEVLQLLQEARPCRLARAESVQALARQAASSDKAALAKHLAIGGALAAQTQPAATATPGEATAAIYPWTAEEDEELIEEDAPMEDVGPLGPDMESDAATSAFLQLEEKAGS